MKNNRLNKNEEAFKSILDEIQLDVNTNEIWNQIEDRVPTVEGDRKIAYWLWAVGVLFIFSSVMFFQSFGISNNDSPIILETNEVNKKSVVSTSNNRNTEMNSNKKDDELTNDFNTIVQKNQIAKNEIDINKKNMSFSKLANENNKSFSSSTEISNKNAGRGLHTLSIVKNNIKTSNEVIVVNEDKQDVFPVMSLLNSIEVSSNSVNVISNIPLLASLKFEEIKVEGNSVLLNDKINYFIEPNIVNTWTSFIKFSSGANLLNSTNRIKNITDEETNVFSNETGQLGFSTSLLYGQRNQSGWKWHVGIGDQYLVAKYQNIDTDVFIEEIVGTTSKEISKNGEIVNTTGKVQKSTINEYDIKWYRRHHTIDLRLGLGKELVSYKGFDLSLNGGIGYTIFSDHKGYFYEKGNSNITKIDKNTVHPYRNYGMIKAYGGLGLHYRVGSYAYGINMNYNQDINDLNIKTNYYITKNSHYGIQFSILYTP